MSIDYDEVAHARHSHPETSHEAAASISSERIRKSQEAVHRVLRRHGPCDDAELVRAYTRSSEPPQSPSGIRTRRDELRRRGLVADTGKRTVLPSGRRAIVWAAMR